MLIQFEVQNHRSLRDKQTLSMVASESAESDARPIPCDAIAGAVLPVAAIYGANASGKSNVLGAMGLMREAVQESHRSWNPSGAIPWDPFLLGGVSTAPANYEMHFVASGTRYRYGFALDAERIHEEWLYAWPNGKKQVWLERERDRFTFGKKLHGENETIRKLTRPNSLFLSAAAQNNHAALGRVYAFFGVPSIVQRLPFAPRYAIDVMASELGRLVERHPEWGDEAQDWPITRLLQGADTGIEAFRVEPADSSLSRVMPTPEGARTGRWSVQVRHRAGPDGSRWLPLGSQSDGTLSLLHIGLRLFDVMEAGGVFLIDELEGSLHPAVAREIVALFQDPIKNPKRAQLIFTTHDTNLLGTVVGEPALRRDQVWLTEKNKAGATTLYPLTDFRPRKEENLERGYLQGRYGAVPLLGALVSGESMGARH